MKREAFVSMLEGYYGAYPRPAVREAVALYLRDYGEDDLDVLMREILLTYSGQYRHTPDIAVMEKARETWNARTLKKIGGRSTCGLALPTTDDSEMTVEERKAAMAQLAAAMARAVKE